MNDNPNPSVFPIVGSFYRPPAKSILAVIPVGTPLEIRPEPANPFDSNAIAIWIKTSDIPESAHKALMLAGADCGFVIGDALDDRAESAESFLNEILLADSWHLGYIPAIIAKKLHFDKPVSGRFLILGSKPGVQQTPDPPRRQIDLD